MCRLCGSKALVASLNLRFAYTKDVVFFDNPEFDANEMVSDWACNSFMSQRDSTQEAA